MEHLQLIITNDSFGIIKLGIICLISFWCISTDTKCIPFGITYNVDCTYIWGEVFQIRRLLLIVKQEKKCK